MKKFLQELAKHPEVYLTSPPDTEIVKIQRKMRSKYEGLVGKQGLLTCRTTKEKRVVLIQQVFDDYILLSYNYYGVGYRGSCNTTVSFRSLHCGDDTLEVEK